MKRRISAALVGMLAIVLAGCSMGSVSTNKAVKTTEVTNNSRQEIASDTGYDNGGWMDGNPEMTEADAVQDAAGADKSCGSQAAGAAAGVQHRELCGQAFAFG